MRAQSRACTRVLKAVLRVLAAAAGAQQLAAAAAAAATAACAHHVPVRKGVPRTWLVGHLRHDLVDALAAARDERRDLPVVGARARQVHSQLMQVGGSMHTQPASQHHTPDTGAQATERSARMQARMRSTRTAHSRRSTHAPVPRRTLQPPCRRSAPPPFGARCRQRP